MRKKSLQPTDEEWRLIKNRAINNVSDLIIERRSNSDIALERYIYPREAVFNRLFQDKPTGFVYLSKFMRPQLENGRELEHLITSSTVGILSLDNHQHRYNNLAQYDESLSSVVSSEIDFLIRKMSSRKKLLPIETLLEFTRISREIPYIPVDLRWLLASGEDDE